MTKQDKYNKASKKRLKTRTQKTQKSRQKVAKELFSEYVKEKKLREPEKKKRVGTNFENILCRGEKHGKNSFNV